MFDEFIVNFFICSDYESELALRTDQTTCALDDIHSDRVKALKNPVGRTLFSCATIFFLGRANL